MSEHVKAGSTTTEWKAFLIAQAFAILTAVLSFLADSGHEWAKLAGVVVAGLVSSLSAAGYIKGRSVVKAAHEAASGLRLIPGGLSGVDPTKPAGAP